MTIHLEPPTVRPAIPLPSELRMTVRRPAGGTAVVEVSGDIDTAGAPRLAELLESRANSTLTRLVIDLGEVNFLGAAGLAAIEHGYQRARERGIACAVTVPAGSPALRTITLFPLRFSQVLEIH
ncbi:STAS domain-containing protein [Amycolatopsis sp. NPDC004378]